MKCSVLVAALSLAACGKVLEVTPDGGGDDDGGGGDAPPDVPVRGKVKVTVLDRAGTGAPVVGNPVIFVEPDGTVTRNTTDSNGKTELDVFPGTSITSVATVSNGRQMITILAVQPGDDVVVGRINPNTATARTFVVNWTAFSGAASYEVYGPCGFQTSTTTATTATITLREDCNPQTMELLVRARNNANATIAFSSKQNIMVAGGTTTMPAFIGGTGLSFTGSFSNISHITNLSMSRKAPDGFGLSLSNTTAIAAQTSTTLTVAVPSTGAARVDTFLTGTNNDQQEVRQKVAGNATTYGLDFAATILPWIAAPDLDVAAHTIALAADPTGTSGDDPDLIETTISWRRGATSFGWTVFGPAFETITLAPLPDELVDGLPLTTDSLTGVRTTAYDADTIGGYAALRSNVGAALVGELDTDVAGAAAVVRTSVSPPGN